VKLSSPRVDWKRGLPLNWTLKIKTFGRVQAHYELRTAWEAIPNAGIRNCREIAGPRDRVQISEARQRAGQSRRKSRIWERVSRLSNGMVLPGGEPLVLGVRRQVEYRLPFGCVWRTPPQQPPMRLRSKETRCQDYYR